MSPIKAMVGILQNVVERARLYRSFKIPSADERSELQPDDLVKLVYDVKNPRKGDTNGERLWFKVTSSVFLPGIVQYRGILLNAPFFLTNLNAGDEVSFGPENVASIEKAPLRKHRLPS